MFLNRFYFFKKNTLRHSKKEFLISVLCSILPLHFYVGTFLEIQGYSTSKITLLIYSLLILIGIVLLLFNISKDLLFLAFFGFVFAFLIGFDLLFRNYDFSFIKVNSVLSLFFVFIPIFISIYTGINLDSFLKHLSFWSRIVLIVMSTVFAYIMFYKKMRIPEYMSFAYYALPPIFFIWSKKEKNIIDYVLILLSSAFVCLVGCRGALLTLLFYYFLLFIHPSKSGKFMLVKFLIIIIAILIAINLKSILLSVSGLLGEYGSRIINILLSDGSFFDSSSRFEIWAFAFNHINIIGYGPIGYRVLFDNGYAHNIVLEILLSYGFVFGGAITIIIYFLVFKNYLSSRKHNCFRNYSLCSFALSFFVIKFMVSDSFLISIDFWLLLALSLWFYNAYRRHDEKILITHEA